ncbi:MAG: protein translocase subunit SecF [Methanobrevibacter sp.]|nr:protein translocase subunit SecF [Methanobrevibacter sp.]
MLELMLEKLMKHYKLFIMIPLIITGLSGLFIAFNGIDEGIDLKGGSIASLKLKEPINSSDLENLLKASFDSQGVIVNEIDVVSNRGTDVTVQIGTDLNSTVFENAIRNKGTIASYNSIGPVLSEEAMGQIYWAIGFAFLFMSIAVFIIFREPVPSFGVILGAFCDMVIALGGMSLFNIPLTIASIGGLLMLIAYSVDTDLLLTTRLLRRKEGTIISRAQDAMKTGLTMSLTAIAAMLVLYIVTIFLIPEASTLSNIAGVLTIGLIADIPKTWLMNLGILRWYMEWKK